MAESSDQSLPANKLHVFKSMVHILYETEELSIERTVMSECRLVQGLNDNTAVMIEALLMTNSALENMIDRRREIIELLKNPMKSNVLLLEHRMHEDFLKYCCEIPGTLNYLKSKIKSGSFATHLGGDGKLISSLGREMKLQRLYISCVKRFLSDLEVYEFYVSQLSAFLKKSEKDLFKFTKDLS